MNDYRSNIYDENTFWNQMRGKADERKYEDEL